VESGEPFFNKLILHLDTAHPGAWNMAADQAWLEQSSAPVLRVYGWDRATVTLGYAQSLAKLAGVLPDWPVVRRWTGGGVVLHEGDFTYSVIVPASDPWSCTQTLESYRRIHGSLAAALHEHGHTGCRLARKEDVVDAPFCFVAPAVHDVIRGPLKVAGAGQRRGRLGLLHQGSVQQVRLKPEFWPFWAARLARSVETARALPGPARERARVLVEARYDRPEWLREREDML